MAQTILHHRIDRASIEALSRSASESDALRAARLGAFDRFEAAATPTDRADGWRRTDFAGIDLAPAEAGRATCRFGVADADAAGGLVVETLEAAAARAPLAGGELLARVHDGLSIGKYSALNEALWRGGAFVRVPDGAEPTAPIAIDWDAGPYPRLLVWVGKNARASVVERHTLGQGLRAGVVDLILEDGAQLVYAHVQNAPRDVVVVSHQRAHIGRDAKLVTLNFAMGGRLSRADVEVELRGQGAESDMLGLIFGEDDQQFDFHTLQGHRAPDTRSDLLYKSALDDRSHSTYTGVISIGKDAPRSEAYQANRNLLLASGARADTQPKLEILIDDVARCTHGATIGPVDDEQLFYLRSRGIDTQTATRLIVEGFFQEVFQKVGDDRVTAGLSDMIAPHVGRLAAP